MRLGVARLSLALLLGLGACGGRGGPPPRGVLERDLDGWSFRRYQTLLETEVWVADNPGVSHAASYARRDAEQRGHLGAGDVVNAVVTRYRTPRGVRGALVRFARRIAQGASHTVEERAASGIRFITIRGTGEMWAMWSAGEHIVKLGGPGRESVPDTVLEEYGERYRSDLEAGALEVTFDEPERPAPAPKR